MNSKGLLILMMLIVHHLEAATTLGADATVAGDTFSFAVSAHAHDADTDTFFTAANETTADNKFGLAMSQPGGKFTALLETTLSLDGVAGTANPLLGKKISLLDTLTLGLPVVVLDTAPATVYLLDRKDSGSPLFSAADINDALGASSAGVVRLAHAEKSHIFAAVKKNGGSFGEGGGGIAVIKNKGTSLDKLNATDGTSGGNVAAAINITSSFLKIVSNLASITANAVDMHFDRHLQRLYIALEVTAGAGNNDGARAIAVGRMSGDILTLDEIAPAAVFTSNNKIVGATGANQAVTIYKVRSLQTSSRLSYLIVAGGNGAAAATGNTIYALPLVDLGPTNETTSADHGKLAKFDATPQDSFHAQNPSFLRVRGMTTPATTAAHVLTSASTAAIVGAGALPIAASQRITDLVALNDGVYVSISSTFDGTAEPGVWHSQAILDELGRIKAWTPWRRAAGTDDKIFGFALDHKSGDMWLMTGASASAIKIVNFSQWSVANGDALLGGAAADPAKGLVSQLITELPRSTGGIHNLVEFAKNTPGFGNVPATVNNQLSCAAVLGFNKVVLAELGRNAVASTFRANTGDFATGKQTFTDGTMTGFVADASAKLLSLSGGVLSDISPLTTAEVSRAPLTGGALGYFFIGGTRGLAVLSRADGTGWSTAAGTDGLKAGFVGLVATMSFKKLGSYTNVRKLMSDGTYLFVLTNQQLDRITISTISGTPTITTLATLSALGLPSHASFSDVVVSNKFALLATSEGLFRVGNSKNITTAATAADVGWVSVAGRGEGIAPATRLWVVSPTGHENGLAQNGMVYVLSGAVSTSQSRVHRFTVKDTSASAIDDTTIQALNDLFVKSVPSFLVEFGAYRNFIATDGVLLYNTYSGNQIVGPVVRAFALYRIADKYSADPEREVFLYRFLFGPEALPAVSSIRQPVRSSASGAWLIGGDAGLLVNE